MTTRICARPGFSKTPIIGIDSDNLLSEGHVYEIKEVLGVLTISDLGKYALPGDGQGGMPNALSTTERIMCDGIKHLITIEEAKAVWDHIGD